MTHNAWERGEKLTVNNANKTQLKAMVEDRDNRIASLLKEIESLKVENKALIDAAAECASKTVNTDSKKYGISVLPENCLPYSHGFRYGAYKTEETRIVEFFKTLDDVQAFVNENPQYGNGGALCIR